MPAPITSSATLVNTYTTDNQYENSITLLPDGGWLALWMSFGEDGSAFGIYAQRYAADGQPAGSAFRVNTTTADSEQVATMAVLADGGWVIAWSSLGSGFEFALYGQRFSAAGDPIGPEFRIDTAPGNQFTPAVAALPDGGWVIAWSSDDAVGAFDTYAQRFDAGGTTVGPEFRVNSTTASFQYQPSITALADGGWLIAWRAYGQDGSDWGVYQQRYDALGVAVGGEARVNTTTAGSQDLPSVAALADGGWVVAWRSPNPDNSFQGIYVQRYDAAGAAVGGQVQASITSVGTQPLAPMVVAMADGGWTVAWSFEDVGASDPTGVQEFGLYARRFSAAGAPGDEVRLGTGLGAVEIAALPDGTLAASWSAYNPDSSSYDVYARTFSLEGGSGNVINGTEGDDSIDGTPGDDLINALGGNDFVWADAGNDHVYGGSGDDTLLGAGGDDHLEGGDGHDFIIGEQGDDNLIGGAGNDLFRGNAGDDVMDGGDGFDRVSFFPSGEGHPEVGVTVSLLLQGVSQDTGHGLDILIGIEALSGTFYDDTLIGDHGTNWLIGGGGAGGAGNDSLYGMGGDDLLEVNSGDHWLDGGDGEDTVSFAGLGLILGGVNANLFAQGAGHSTGQGIMTLTGIENLSGTPFTDILTGDNGDNLLAGDGGDDALVGASGNDRLYGDGAVMADLPAGGAGTSGPPTLFADLGGGGNDSLDAGAGDDVLVGGGGNDLLQGGPGNDTLDGGAGTDTASFATGVGPVFVDLNAGIASGGDGNDTLVSVENALGSVFNDQLYAYSGGSRLVGNGGNDLIFGLGGDDWLQGNSGNDQLRGNSGNDRLEGGEGVDLMFGGTGADSYDGGDGFDRVGFTHFSATQGVVANLVTQTILNDGFGNAETMVSVEALGPGTALADHFTGDDNANYLLGDRGDTLIGNGGDDTIQLGSAPALIDGGDGVDAITQFIGDLVGYLVPDNNGDGLADLVFATRGVEVDLGRGMIVDDGSGNSGTLISIENVGGSGLDDTLIGDDGVNDLTGFAGDDLLEGGLGNDTLNGGGGSDTARYASASGAVFVDLASGTAGGAAGNDILIGMENVSGSAFGDEIVGDAGANLLAGEDGDDIVVAFGGDDEVHGGDGDDDIEGRDGNDILVGDEGNDSIGGDAGDDLIAGGAGNDFLVGGAGDDEVDGGEGEDTIDGGDGIDLLFGGSGHDALRGRAGADELHGGDGDDFVGGGFGDDIIDGGAGFDRATFSNDATAGVTVDLRIDGVAQNTGQGMDILIGIENVSGTRFSDVLRGDEGDNWIWGGSDGSGVTGDDILRGGGGNDLILVGTGNHFLRGGSGTDTLSLYGFGIDITAAGVTVSLALQGAAQNTEQGMMNLKGFESLSGSIFQDFLTGNNADNLLAGDSGNDNLSGGNGDDTLYGDGRVIIDDSHGAGTSGPIVTHGDVADLPSPAPSGNDILDGGKGDDILVGGGGDDVLTGGQGRDTFTFGANDGDDRITDFQNKDTIRFEGIAGVDDFGDLILTRIGQDTLITWGTGDSLLVEGTRPNQLHASDFIFG